MNTVLVVCEGNICRSPMAEGLLQRALATSRVHSAGLGALVGQPADQAAVRLMHERDVDISAHRAVQLTQYACVAAELILVMDREQQARVAGLYPQARGRIFRIGEFSKIDIPDPYRKPVEAFRQALHLIEQGVDDWLKRIKRL